LAGINQSQSFTPPSQPTYQQNEFDESFVVESQTQPQPTNFPVKKVEKPKPTKTIVAANGVKSMRDLGHNANHDVFRIKDEAIADFLGNVERKPVHSVVMTIDAPQGSGKTRAGFQLLNALAESGYSCLFVSLEEHPESKLFIDKRDQYLSPEASSMIHTIGELEKGMDTLNKIVENYDVIFIDSWGKLGKYELDDFRKAHDGKFIIAIFQRVTGGSMRGGASAQYDGDMICKGFKGETYEENYLYWDKNRYSDKHLHYYINGQFTIDPSELAE